MPTPTYTPLANITLGATAASVTFGSIPGTYRDLVLVITARNTIGNGYEIYARINGDTNNNYPTVFMGAETSSLVSFARNTNGAATIGWSDGTNNGIVVAHFLDYSTTDKHKHILSRNGNVDQAKVYAEVVRWANTSTITSIQLLNIGTPLFTAGSTFALYGIVG
jgi:hypothetical protein